MKWSQRISILALLAATASVIIGGLGPMDRDAMPTFEEDHATNTLLVDVANYLSESERSELVESFGLPTTLNSVFSEKEGLFRVTGDVSELEALRETLANHRDIEFVEFEQEYAGFGVVANDPLYQFQWNFDQVNAEAAWKSADGGSTVVAVIDTGVAFTRDEQRGYPALRDLESTGFASGYDFVDDDDFPFDEHGHGTHVAGTIAQSTGNRYGVAGLAPGASIMPIRVLNADGRGTTADIAEAIRFAADNGADIINMSLGGPIPSQLMTDAINYAHRKGVTVIAAAGNNGWSIPSFPAANPNVFAVSATQFDRTKTFYSNYGRYIDIAAPGGNTRVDQNDDGRPDGILQETVTLKDPRNHEFALYMGTSMASPHVAGVAALIHSQGVTRPERIESLLMESADKNVPDYNESEYGAGLLDAGAAIQQVYNDHRAPLWFLFLAGFGLLVSRREKLLGATTFGIGATAGLLMLSGLEPLDFVMSKVGITGLLPEVLLAGWHEAALEWLPIGFVHNVMLWSAAPILLMWAIFGHAKSASSRAVLCAAGIAWASMLAAQALSPTISLAWFPNLQWLESTWLLANALIAAGIIFIGSRDQA